MHAVSHVQNPQDDLWKLVFSFYQVGALEMELKSSGLAASSLFAVSLAHGFSRKHF